MSFINAYDWNDNQVGNWILGLDSSLSIYGPHFISKRVNGAKLLTFMAGDLEYFGIHRVGDQLLLYEAITSLRNEMEADRITMQSLASRLSVRCKTFRSELSNLPRKNRIPNESLASAAYLIDSAKSLLSWMTRFPFLGKMNYDTISRNLTKHSFELALLSQRDLFADNAIEDVQYLCTKMIEICDHIILECKDSLILQPAAIDVITIRKRQEQELGLQFESSYSGIHRVSGVVQNSPAQQCGHLERGDEILQVNYQTVIAWKQNNLISLLGYNPCEVTITVKRRPRHACNMLGHMYRPNSVPARKLASPVIEEGTEKQICTKETLEETKKDEESVTPNLANNAETRFWKLYPRPKSSIRRRATVSGASPTSTRPPVTFVKDNPSGVSHRRHPLDKSKSESHKLDLDDQILKLFIGKCNIQGSRITLPLMENLVLKGSNELIPAQPNPQDASNLQIPLPAESPNLVKSVLTVEASVAEVSKTLLASSHSDLSLIASVSAPNLNTFPHSGDTIYSGYLHKRGQWKSGPRWTRFKATVSPKLLTIGASSYKLGSSDFVIGVANEVHSRPFAFKLEETNAEKRIIYVAAESQLEMQMWIKVLTIETQMTTTLLFSDSNSSHYYPPKLFRRSTSLQPGSPPLIPEKPLRRISLPQQVKPCRSKVATRASSHFVQQRSDEKRCLTAIATPPPYTKSNISSITITSLKRYDGNIVDSKMRPRLPRQDARSASSKMPLEIHRSPNRTNCDSRRLQTVESENGGKPKLGVGVMNWKGSGNLNSNSAYCRACGTKLHVQTMDSATQTNDNIFILINGDCQSVL